MDEITVKIMVLIIGYFLAIIFFFFDYYYKKNEKEKELSQLKKNNKKGKLEAIQIKERELSNFKSKYIKWGLVIIIISALGISGGIYLIFNDDAQGKANAEEKNQQGIVINQLSGKVDSVLNASKQQSKRDSLIFIAIQDSMHVKGLYLKQNLGIGNLYNVNYQSPLIKFEGGTFSNIKMSNIGNVNIPKKH